MLASPPGSNANTATIKWRQGRLVGVPGRSYDVINRLNRSSGRTQSPFHEALEMARRVVGQVLREARERAGLSLRDLERLCGMTTSQLSQVETGRRADPAFGTVMRMADGIGVSLSEISEAMRGAGKPEIRIDPGTRVAVETAARIEEAKRNLERSLVALQAALETIPSAKPRSSRRSRR